MLLKNSFATSYEIEKFLFNINKLYEYIKINTEENTKIINNDNYNIKIKKIKLIEESLKNEYNKILNVQNLIEESSNLIEELDYFIKEKESNTQINLDIANKINQEIKVKN